MRPIITLFILLFCLTVEAAGPVAHFDRLSIKDGLSQNSVVSIVQDAKGFMWFATQDGLNRFDGYEFKVFRHDPADPDSISDNNIQSLYLDLDNVLWISTRGGGLNRYDASTESFAHFTYDKSNPDSLGHNAVWSVHEDSQGAFWVALLGGGLDRFDRKNQRFEHFQHNENDPHSLSHNMVLATLHDRFGTLWVGTRGGGLNRFDDKTRRFERFRAEPDNPYGLAHDNVWIIFEDSRGTLWVGTDGGLSRLDRQTGRFVHFRHHQSQPHSISGNKIRSIFEDSQGALWVGTMTGGLNRFDPSAERFERFKHHQASPNSLSRDNVQAIYEDSKGVFWIGTYGGGLNKYQPLRARFGHFKHQLSDPYSLSHNNIRAIYKANDGPLWIGTDGGGLNRYDAKNKRFIHYQHQASNHNSLSNNRIWSIVADEHQALWAGTWGGGLAQYNHRINQFEHFRHQPDNPNSINHDIVISIFSDKNGIFWLGSWGGGLDRIDTINKQVKHFRHQPSNPKSLSNDKVTTIHRDGKGRLWVGTYDGGVNRYDETRDVFKHFKSQASDPSSLSHNSVTTIRESRAGQIWIGTKGGGLNKYNEQSEGFSHYREKDGLANDSVYGILEDAAGYLWLSTNQGLSKLDPASGRFRNFDADDGLQSNEFLQGASFQGADGELFFGGINGFNRFYPNQISDDNELPTVVLTNFLLANQPVAIQAQDAQKTTSFTLPKAIDQLQHLTLSHEQNLMSFEFAALNISSPMKSQYAYQLSGFDQTWIYTDAKKRWATYTNTPPGDYTLRIKASNPDGYWNEQGKALKITILPPPWQTWWAWLIYLLIFVGLLILLAYLLNERRKGQNQRTMLAQLKQVDKLKDEFLANTSHELRTPLNGIIGLAESLIDGIAGQLPRQANEHLSLVVSSGKRLSNLVNDILDFSKLESHGLNIQIQPIDLYSVTEVVMAMSQHLIGEKKLVLINNVPQGLAPAKADEERLQQILYNLIGNGIKFSERGSVVVSAEQQDDILAISVKDSGIGIAANKFDDIFKSFEQIQGSDDRRYGGTGLGLAVSKQLIELHGGQISVESTLKQGSTFCFTLPVSHDKPLAGSGINLALARLRLLQKNGGSALEHQIDNIAVQMSDDEVMPSVLPDHDGSAFRLLLVDDEPINRLVLRNYLSRQNYQLVEASGGAEALKAIHEDGPFDLVLLDIMMPTVSGYDVCEKIRETWPVNDLPVIFLTAKNQEVDVVKSFAVGANDYLAKPVAKHELLARVETHLKLLDINRNLEDMVVQRTTELERSNQKITALIGICSQINSTLDVNALRDIAYNRIKDLMDADVFYIGQYQPSQNNIVFHLAIESNEYFPSVEISMDEQNRPSVLCVKRRKPVIINDPERDFPTYFSDMPLPKALIGGQPGSQMCWPLVVGDHIIGVLSVESYQKNAYSEHHQHIIQTLAATLAIALDNAHAYREVEQKNREVQDKNREVEEKNSEIIATQQQLVQAEKMASLGTLTAGVAHEINNPTNFVHVSAQNLEVDLAHFEQFLLDLAGDDADEEIIGSFKQRFRPLYRHLSTIQDGTERIKTIVQDLRAFSQLDSATKKTVCITDLLQSTVHLIQTKYLELAEFETIFEAKPQLHCYPAQLNQVFMNLIVNACDAIRDKQRQQGHKQLGKVTIGCDVRDNMVEISVRDDGWGMNELTKNKLFEPFYTTKEVGEGTGLGLSISFGIVQNHGGQLTVESELSVGTVFSVCLPLAVL